MAQEIDLIHQAQENLRREQDFIKQIRDGVTDICGENPEYHKTIDSMELEHIDATVTWLQELIAHLNSMKKYVQEQLSIQHTKSMNADVKDACFKAYETLINQYDIMLKNWQPVLNLYEKQQRRLKEKQLKLPNNLKMSILNVGIPARHQNYHTHKIKEWMQDVKTRFNKKSIDKQLDSFADAVGIIIKKEYCLETINMLEQLIKDLENTKLSIIAPNDRNEFEKIINRWERKLQVYKTKYANYASADALAAALEQAKVI